MPTYKRGGNKTVPKTSHSWRNDKRKTTERMYGWEWQKARLFYLARNPLCVMCQRANKIVQATVVNHVKAHRGDEKLFWDRSNWQSLCTTHHNSEAQMIDHGRKPIRFDQTGYPIEDDPEPSSKP